MSDPKPRGWHTLATKALLAGAPPAAAPLASTAPGLIGVDLSEVDRTTFDLTRCDPSTTPGYTGTKDDAAARLAERGLVLSGLQERLYANGRAGDNRRVLLILQGMDTSGKGGIVRHVVGLMDPQGVRHASFGAPTAKELAHHYLWRIKAQLPGPGQIGCFDRSHYEDVLAVRVQRLVPESIWEPRYEEINRWERRLVDAGTTIVKCLLVISLDEQRARLTERLVRPEKYWKYDPSDLEARKLWPEYREAYQAVLDRTHTTAAPWHVIPADRKWFARLAVTELLIGALESLDLGWPPPSFDPKAERAKLAAL